MVCVGHSDHIECLPVYSIWIRKNYHFVHLNYLVPVTSIYCTIPNQSQLQFSKRWSADKYLFRTV